MADDIVRARTIHDAVSVALEALPGSDLSIDILRAHALEWVHSFARVRGVILSDSDITSEFDKIVSAIRQQRGTR